MQNTEKRWFGIKETAEYLGISHKTLYNQTSPKSENPFPVKPKRLGRKILFDRLELDSYLESI
jgi:predicted DNA-binding transcriptional regulator AlpA